MEDISINNVHDYETLRKALGNELSKTAISVCRIGYLLKRARDEAEILKAGGYSDVHEFAMSEFGLDRSRVSRFIRINDRFSIGGYSDQLKGEYEKYGYAKLSLMLLLPDEINEEIPADYSKSEIEAIVNDYKAEKEITDIEVLCEDDSNVPDEFIMAVVKELNDEHPDPARELNREFGRDVSLIEVDDAKAFYMPEDARAFNIRIPGQGRFMVSMKEDIITIINMRRPEEKSPLPWQEFTAAVIEDIKTRGFPEPEKQKEEAPKKKIKKVEPAKKKDAPVQYSKSDESKAKMSNIDEKCTENDEKCTESPESGNDEPENAHADDSAPAAGPTKSGTDEDKSVIDKAVLKGYKAGLKADMHVCERLIDDDQFQALRTKLEGMLQTVNRIIDSEG